jgi:hypothetical protein
MECAILETVILPEFFREKADPKTFPGVRPKNEIPRARHETGL